MSQENEPHGIHGPVAIDEGGERMVEPMKKAVDAALYVLRQNGIKNPEIILICDADHESLKGKKRLSMLTSFHSERKVHRIMAELTTKLSRLLRGMPVKNALGEELYRLDESA